MSQIILFDVLFLGHLVKLPISPAGYQQSWGAAEEVVNVLKENLPK